ncbi:MAG TPA: indole-3-glycerol phosphate synthase TrpC [Thermoanaerobaculia bacterium]|nr:indole-3-glycerol phosphate synthase TrpC [Thermoanaerobaculia bacterium]
MSAPEVADILARILERRRRRVAAAPGAGRPLPEAAASRPLQAHENRFLGALARRRGRAIIAEVKLGSPSLGPLEDLIEPLEVARAYAAFGAAALSVVVEPDFFYGNYELLAACRRVSGLPAIAKDFIVDPVQIEWARQAGADAVLLLAAVYSRDDLVAYAAEARRQGLAPLVEIHDLSELTRLQGLPWELVGVNNRDLRTFKVEISHGLALASTLPTGALKVAESGIHGAADLHLLASSGYDAFLVGEALLTAADPAAKLQELLA